MDQREQLFAAIKMLFILTILVELATLKAALCPTSFLQYIQILFSYEMYIEHIFLSLVFLGGGALLFLKKA